MAYNFPYGGFMADSDSIISFIVFPYKGGGKKAAFSPSLA